MAPSAGISTKFTRGQRNCNLCNCHAMHNQTCTTVMQLLFRASQSDLLTYPGLSRISPHTRALSRISSHTRALSRISLHIQAPESDLFTYPAHESDLLTYPALSRISLHTRAPESDLLTYPAISRISLHTRALSRISSHIGPRHGTASFNLSTHSYLPSKIQSRIIDSRRRSRKQSPLGKPECLGSANVQRASVRTG